jgi:ribonucleotide reductase alpha subunit
VATDVLNYYALFCSYTEVDRRGFTYEFGFSSFAGRSEVQKAFGTPASVLLEEFPGTP